MTDSQTIGPDDVAAMEPIDAEEEAIMMNIAYLVKRRAFIQAKAARQSTDPEDPTVIEYRRAKKEYSEFRGFWRGVRDYVRETTLADDQAEPEEDSGDATARPAPISVSSESSAVSAEGNVLS